MTIREYEQAAISTAIYGRGSKIIYPTIGLAGEAGEVSNKVKKILRDDDGIFSKEKALEIASEIGDVMWYCAALARDLDVSLEAIAEMNLAKLARRKIAGTLKGSGDAR